MDRAGIYTSIILNRMDKTIKKIALVISRVIDLKSNTSQFMAAINSFKMRHSIPYLVLETSRKLSQCRVDRVTSSVP